MNQSSSFIQPPTMEQLLSLASEHGLVLQPQSISYNESGLDFLVALAKDKAGISWVLRLPRRGM
ncbi:hypothetical protein [Rhodocytophaga rosea]|uniref:hypothetical protein n=1 Tax=Rhodocytophaga rosea TaxID=2704465 RepID=UPI001E2AE6B8|nr:hypothetical protein [Rhodocytophaga rosea]